MKTVVRAALIVAGSLTALQSATAQVPGANPECICTVDAPGTIAQTTGDVLVTRRAGFAPADAGDVVRQGTVIATGPSGSATVAFGSGCSVSIGPDQRFVTVRTGPQLCATVQQNALGAGVGTGLGGPPPFVTPEGIFGAAASAAVAAFVTERLFSQ